METKLYVGNISFNTTEEELSTLFSQAGTVESVTIIKDRDTGRSKGFAFVMMSNQEEVEKAIQMFNQFELSNRELKVSIARPREERGSGGYRSQGRGGGGGYNRSNDRRARTNNKNRY